MVKVSVLMPVYRTDEKFLREAIESILNQTYRDFEFIILDDCPEDTRESIVKSYNDERIRYYINEKNLGISASRNKLLELSTGEYLAIFDHDDISMPERLARQVAFLDENPEYGVVGTRSKTMIKGRQSKYPAEDHDIKRTLMRACAITHSSSMIRKSVLIDNGIRYEEEFSPSEDYALFCRLIKYTKFHNINDEVLFLYRDHENNTTRNQMDKMRRATISIWSFAKAEYPALYNEFLLTSSRTIYFRLFGFIPLATIKIEGIRTRCYLFGLILLWSTKTSIRMNDINMHWI